MLSRGSLFLSMALAAVQLWPQVVEAQQLAPPPPMRAGGLAPPPANSVPVPATPQQPNVTWRQLEESGAQDSGRGLEFVYLNVDVGPQLMNIEAFEKGMLLEDNAMNIALTPLAVGVGAGLRLLYFTVGPRFQYGHFTAWDFWTLNLDVGWHIPLGRFEPYAVLGAGYAKMPGANKGFLTGDRDVSVTGFDVRLGGGFDYYVSNAFSVGGMLDFKLIRLARSGVALEPGEVKSAGLLGGDASAVGYALTAGAVLGLHY